MRFMMTRLVRWLRRAMQRAQWRETLSIRLKQSLAGSSGHGARMAVQWHWFCVRLESARWNASGWSAMYEHGHMRTLSSPTALVKGSPDAGGAASPALWRLVAVGQW